MKKIFFIIIWFSLLLNATIIRDNTKEVVIDSNTNLMWQDNSSAKYIKVKWTDAIDYCETLKFAGYSDWRLPNVRELYSIVEHTVIDPSIVNGFKNITSYYYWSSTTQSISTNQTKGWLVGFMVGKKLPINKNDSHYVRCVRDNN